MSRRTFGWTEQDQGFSLRRERPLLFALLCSGAVHGGLALVATMMLAVLRPAHPEVRQAFAMRAMLVSPTQLQLPEPLERIEAPTLAPLLLPLFLPEPPTASAPVQPSLAPSTIARTSPAPAPTARETHVLDPNGSVTVGVLTDEQRVGSVASTLADRYRVRPDRLPRLTAALIVPYPASARRARTSARVAAVIDLDDHGRIANARVIPDDGVFAPAVLEALKEARFAPAELAAHPVPYWAVLEFNFAIAPQ